MSSLPHIFKTEVKHTTNLDVSTSRLKEIRKDTKSVTEKLNDIFTDPSYVYKKRVVVKTKDDVIENEIIARNKEKIIMLDNTSIYLKDIIDIYPK